LQLQRDIVAQELLKLDGIASTTIRRDNWSTAGSENQRSWSTMASRILSEAGLPLSETPRLHRCDLAKGYLNQYLEQQTNPGPDMDFDGLMD
jgi:hypothetical protein